MKITLTRPDDWHLHLRDDTALIAVASASAQVFKRAIIMPNLKPPVTTVQAALAYRERILAAVPPESGFEPLMTLYLTDSTPVEEIARIKDCPHVVAVKYYPAGATTNSQAGVTDLRKVWPVLEAMQEADIPLLIHGEVTVPEVDIFDREYCFISHILDPLSDAFPRLRIVLEHITTREAVDFILAGEDRVAATITAHHLLYSRNAIFNAGIRPHFYCLPVLKRESHREALLQAATSGSPRFFLGTDSAPHPRHNKENTCGCAGIYTAPIAMPLYIEAFEQMHALNKLEGFASFYGAKFYGLPLNTEKMTFHKQAWRMPESLPFGAAIVNGVEQPTTVVPLCAGEQIAWQLA